MAQPHILQQFNQYAIAQRFSGVQTQLWHCLYWLTHTYGQGVCIPTYHLLETMGISRSQLLRARKALEDAGCLRIHKTGAQRTHYTVMVDGMIVDMNDGVKNNASKNNNVGIGKCGTLGTESSTNKPMENGRGCCPQRPATMHKNRDYVKPQKSQPTGVAPQPDIVMNGEMEQQIETFTTRHGYSRMAGRKLLAWYRMRRQHGWTMTLPGFVSTMDALQTYCSGDEDMLIKIVNRTLQHQWKGFHPYVEDRSAVANKTNTGPNRYHKQSYHKQSARLPKYETKYEDLDYLEW